MSLETTLNIVSKTRFLILVVHFLNCVILFMTYFIYIFCFDDGRSLVGLGPDIWFSDWNSSSCMLLTLFSTCLLLLCSGYQGDGRVCTLIDRCSVNNGGCHPQASCSSALGNDSSLPLVWGILGWPSKAKSSTSKILTLVFKPNINPCYKTIQLDFLWFALVFASFSQDN